MPPDNNQPSSHPTMQPLFFFFCFHPLAPYPPLPSFLPSHHPPHSQERKEGREEGRGLEPGWQRRRQVQQQCRGRHHVYSDLVPGPVNLLSHEVSEVSMGWQLFGPSGKPFAVLIVLSWNDIFCRLVQLLLHGRGKEYCPSEACSKAPCSYVRTHSVRSSVRTLSC